MRNSEDKIMRKIILGNLIPYKAQYRNSKEAEKAWNNGCEFILESKGHCLDGLLVTVNIFDSTDSFRLFLQGRKGKFIVVSGS